MNRSNNQSSPPTGVGGKGDPVGHDLKQADVVVGEPAGNESTDVQDSDDSPTDQQRHPEQGADPMLPKDRIKHIPVIDPLNDHRLLVRRDATGETLPHRNAKPLTYRRFEPPGGGNDKLLARGLEKQRSGGIDLKKIPHSSKDRSNAALMP